MTAGRQNRIRNQTKAAQVATDRNDELPYFIELWNETDSQVERVLARASKVSLARAIFKAALAENPGRRITLRHGSRIVSDGPQG
ncbi:MAG TPA: hypothetical protein VH189_15520 [Rhizomicrobium sp.]|jgi:hypothetical protein|nr:hypothetical protein [Rhizomicrobium sp.]